MSKEEILYKILLIPGILLAFTFHEYAHGYVADKLGDKTPRFQGRLTFNPLVHIDPIGFIAILVFGFGWAKPIQVNPLSFKNYYKDDLKVSIAGVIGNLILALIASIVLGMLYIIGEKIPNVNPEIFGIITKIVYLTIYINCLLAVFNLLPVPGFDGFNVLKDLFPKVLEPIQEKTMGFQIILFLLVINFAGYIIEKPVEFLLRFFMNIVGIF